MTLAIAYWLCINIVYNNYVPINYGNPVTTRLNETEQEIVKKIQATLERPGLVVTISDAIKVSLHFWAEHNIDPMSNKENNLPEN